MSVELIPINGLPDVLPGTDLSALFDDTPLAEGDILVLAQKIVSKAERRLVDLATVKPSAQARAVALRTEKDARLVHLIIQESNRIIRMRPGVLIVEDVRGWVCANAGIDRSNVPQGAQGEHVCLLPSDPDRSASDLRASLQTKRGVTVGVLIADSHGRAWREGTVGVAIGASGLQALRDLRGASDRYGYQLQHTLVATADEIAAAASLLMGQSDEGVPAVLVRGLTAAGDGRARDLQRDLRRDLFR